MYKGIKIIAMCISKASKERNTAIIQAMNTAAVQNGCRLLVYHTCSDLYWKTQNENGEKAVFDLIDYRITDAVVVFNDTFYDNDVIDKIFADANANNVPVINVGAIRENCINITFDYAKGFDAVVRHVIEYHKVDDVCMIAGKEGEPNSDERIAVYKRVLLENGITPDESRIYYGDYWYMPTELAMQKILALDKLPKAIICANDMMAITVCDVLARQGYSVPQDVIVSGFDATVEAKSNIPPITTSGCSYDNMALTIVKAINDISVGIKPEPSYSVECQLNIYSSCGCGNISEYTNVGGMLKSVEDRFNKYQDDEYTLYELSEVVISCRSSHDFAVALSRFGFEDICIIMNGDSLDIRNNPTLNVREKSFDDIMQILLCSEVNISDCPKPFSRKKLLPNIDDVFVRKNPIIYSAISCFGIPSGFICFFFEPNQNNYCKIQQYLIALNRVIDSYRMVKYLSFSADNIERMSREDFMTDLYNRKGFYDMLPELLKNNRKKYILVATVDVDGLKNINDVYGHENGDLVIRTVSEAVKEVPFETKLCGRFGGDEFVVCAVTSKENAEEMFLRSIKEYLDDMNDTLDKKFKISASVGVYITAKENFDFDYFLKQSDEKMYLMKIGRPNRRKS